MSEQDRVLSSDQVTPADEERGAFIDWPREMGARGYALHEGADAAEITNKRPAPDPALFADPTGHPPVLWGRRTGYGRVVWRSRWHNVLEWLRRPEMRLRRFLLESWGKDGPILHDRVTRRIPIRLLRWAVRRGWVQIIVDDIAVLHE